MSSHPREACINCHFLSTYARESPETTLKGLSTENRDMIRDGNVSWNDGKRIAVECFFRVWSAPSPVDEAKFIETVIATDRKNYCFFWPNHPGMAMKPAETLQRIHADRQEAAPIAGRRFGPYGSPLLQSWSARRSAFFRLSQAFGGARSKLPRLWPHYDRRRELIRKPQRQRGHFRRQNLFHRQL